MAGAKKVVEDVLFECTINNIWTTHGKLKFGETIMLNPDEAEFLKGRMRAALKKAMGGK